mgnify:CR=1 FL=1
MGDAEDVESSGQTRKARTMHDVHSLMGRPAPSNEARQSIHAGRHRTNVTCAFDNVPSAIHAIERGEFVLVLDDENRENEGDLIIAADAVTPEKLAFMVRHTSGLICVAMPGRVLDRLHLPPMVQNNEDPMRTAFSVSVDLRQGISTGISAADRAATIAALAQTKSSADDFVRPGHVFPLRAREGGVTERPGHTEAAYDLVRLAGCGYAGVLCEVVNDDGTMARRPDLMRFAIEHGIALISIAQLVAYCGATEMA